MSEAPTNEIETPVTSEQSTGLSPLVADVFTSMFAASEKTTNRVFDNYERQIAEWKAAYVVLWDAVNQAAEVLTTRRLERVLEETSWRRDNAQQKVHAY